MPMAAVASTDEPTAPFSGNCGGSEPDGTSDEDMPELAEESDSDDGKPAVLEPSDSDDASLQRMRLPKLNQLRAWKKTRTRKPWKKAWPPFGLQRRAAHIAKTTKLALKQGFPDPLTR